MKRIIIITLLYLCAVPLHAQQNADSYPPPCIDISDSMLKTGQLPDSVRIIISQFITPVIFGVNQYEVQRSPRLDAVVDSIRKQQRDLAYLWIIGSASPDGSLAWNQTLGEYRAEALARYLSERTKLPVHMLRTHNTGEDWSSLQTMLQQESDFPNRDQVLDILAENQDTVWRKQAIQKLDQGKTWRKLIDELFPPLRNARLAFIYTYPKLSPIVSPGLQSQTLQTKVTNKPISPEKLILIQETPVNLPRDSRKSDWKIAIKNNLLFDALLVANLGVEISPWEHWSLDLPVWYSPYNISSTRNIRLLGIQPEIRWWSREAMKGHFIGLHTHVLGFNIALNDYARYQDPNHALWGMGLSYGYALSLGKSEHWGLEFTLGAGFANYRYDAYRNEDNGPKFKSGSDRYWGITRAGITLSYKWILSHKNRKI